jgi:hypothetical protein
MKKGLITLLVVVSWLVCSPLFAASLKWDAVTQNVDNTPCTDLAGYNAYDVTAARTKVNTTTILPAVCTAGICTWTIPGTPTEGKKYVVTAIDTSNNESGDSNIATYGIAPKAPGGLIAVSSLIAGSR